MPGMLTLEHLQPGTAVRIGLRASGPKRRSYYLRIVTVEQCLPDGQVTLEGDRLTISGRPVERLKITVPIDELYPVIGDW